MMVEIKDEKEAFLAIIFACMSADSHVSAQELKEMTTLLGRKKLFKEADMLDMYTKIQSLHQAMDYNSFRMIEIAASKIRKEYKPTVYAHAIGIFLADKNFHGSEKQLCTFLQKVLDIEDELASRIQEVVGILNMG